MIINDKTIYKIALITSIVGISILIVSSAWVEPKEMKIKDITSNNINEKITIHGVITKIDYSSSSKTCFLSLNDGTGKIQVIIFQSGLENFETQDIDISSFKNRNVKLTGTVSEYNNQLEITLDDSKLIRLEK
ncbi:RNA-binding protein [Methanobrevibacter sp. 87.7]|uniref:exodeoxyribonuclease VII large subunit n=1 Tax=Methanobrevibacter sp. 87.7 TaxID=387957 RepID=UPI000B507D8A|nr:exodeoxyribonuclease VII large subunit [Methanobrevibacter sp. 87.7]OWT33275.1 RNA-binding protein [Methanobrevibacter sp. 87.7]